MGTRLSARGTAPKHPVNSKQMPRTPKTSPTRAPPGKRVPAGRFQVERLTAGLPRALYLKPVGFESRASFAPARAWGASPGPSTESPFPGSCRAERQLYAWSLPEVKQPSPGDAGATLLCPFVVPSSGPTPQAGALDTLALVSNLALVSGSRESRT